MSVSVKSTDNRYIAFAKNVTSATWVVLLVLLSTQFVHAREDGPSIRVVHSPDNETHVYTLEKLASAYPNIKWDDRQISPTTPRGITSLVVTFGENALASELESGSSTPILATLISRVDFERLTRGSKKRQISGIFSDPNLTLQFALTKAWFGGKRDIAVIIHDQEIELERTVLNTANFLDLSVNIHRVRGSESISTAISDISPNTPLIAIPDSRIFNTDSFRQFILACYRREIPVIGFTSGMVKAGTVGTIVHNTDAHVAEVKHYIADFFLGKRKPVLRYISSYDIDINPLLARSLNIPTILPTHLEASIAKIAGDEVNRGTSTVSKR